MIIFTELSNTVSFPFKLPLDCQPANNDMESLALGQACSTSSYNSNQPAFINPWFACDSVISTLHRISTSSVIPRVLSFPGSPIYALLPSYLPFNSFSNQSEGSLGRDTSLQSRQIPHNYITLKLIPTSKYIYIHFSYSVIFAVFHNICFQFAFCNCNNKVINHNLDAGKGCVVYTGRPQPIIVGTSARRQ